MVTAIVLAAGLSSRMGQSKPLLPWGSQTLIEHIVWMLRRCSVGEILVVTGHNAAAVEERLARLPVRAVFNPGYARGEMLSSVQAGLQAASASADAALIALGDQPPVEPAIVERLIDARYCSQATLVVPSYERRRGHPLLLAREHWPAVLALAEGQSLRDFFRNASPAICYVEVDTPDVLRDMDSPADYQRELAHYLSRQHAHIER
jgi:molybdenum cofactor cytidylyltransferase